MAVPHNFNIQINPEFISSAYRPIIFRVLCTVAVPELQIKADVYVRKDITESFELIATKYQKRYKGEDYFIFDFSNILQTQLTLDRETTYPAAATTTDCQESIIEYKVWFTEVYYDTNGFPQEVEVVKSAVMKAVNSIWQPEDDHNLDDYIYPGWTVGRGFSDGFSVAFGNTP